MCILTRDEIFKEIEAGNISIEPFDRKNVGPASVDLRLGNEIRRFKHLREPLKVDEDSDYKQITTLEKVRGHFMLMPDESIQSMTLEKITLPGNICGWLQGRSRFARLGLMIHITASFMQPGISNHQVLEIKNVSPIPLLLSPKTKVCQFIFERCEGEARYSGKFADQKL